MEAKIPIKNIYYMLCYAWDKLKEKDIVSVDESAGKDIYDLFARVLISGLNHLIKRGMDRAYINVNEDVSTLRGKINFNESMKRILWLKGKLTCEFDELSYNILHNQIIKSTLNALINNEEIDISLKNKMIELNKYFRDIDDMKLSKKLFGQVKINRNNHYYGFLINICEIIFDNLLVDEKSGYTTFRDFERDERQMAYLFEHFVRKFYKRELNDYTVYRENIYWSANENDVESFKLLPHMQTDISIESINRKIIMDTKYYKDVFTYNMDIKKLNSSNLYQLFAYLINNESKGGVNLESEGILLYPTVNEEVDLEYFIQGHRISIKTLNLNQEWQEIHNRLLEIIELKT